MAMVIKLLSRVSRNRSVPERVSRAAISARHFGAPTSSELQDQWETAASKIDLKKEINTMRVGGGARDPVGLRIVVEEYKRLHTIVLSTFKAGIDSYNGMEPKQEEPGSIENLKMKQRDGMNMRVIANANPPKRRKNHSKSKLKPSAT